MPNTFDPDAFVTRIGERLVREFNDARSATSPSTIGAAMEKPVRHQLEQILPRGIAVGSGFVIDTKGGTSRQMDVVLYERDICPVFSVNNTPETTYYPCEGVIAIGEIKSAIDKRSLEDSFKKIASAKSLKRHAVHHPVPDPKSGERFVIDRGYGSFQKPSILNFDKGDNYAERAQIFGFILAGKARLSPDTFCSLFRELARQSGDDLSPNFVATLSGEVLVWSELARGLVRSIEKKNDSGDFALIERTGSDLAPKTKLSAMSANCFHYSDGNDTFRTLVRWLCDVYRNGKTSDVAAFDSYFHEKSVSSSGNHRYVAKHGTSVADIVQQLGIRKHL